MKLSVAAAVLFATTSLEQTKWVHAQTMDDGDSCQSQDWSSFCPQGEFLVYQNLAPFFCWEFCSSNEFLGRTCGHCPDKTPSAQPSEQPTPQPSAQPSSAPSPISSIQPSVLASAVPTKELSVTPTTSAEPSTPPSPMPSLRPSISQEPSTHPSKVPSMPPSVRPSLSQQPTLSMIPSSMPIAAPRRVFVTSSTHQGNLGGLTGADAICQGAANSKNFQTTFKAWLSDSTGSPDTRFFKSNGPYVLVNGDKVASNWDDLVDGELDNLIDLDENGDAVDGYVYTNTNTDGTVSFLIGNSDCEDWSSSSSDPNVSRPSVAHTTVILSFTSWTRRGRTSRSGDNCASRFHLFCFEQ